MVRLSPHVHVLPQSNVTSSVEAVVIAQDGSIVLAGTATGDFSGTNIGGSDFIAVKLSPEMDEIWRWQASNRAGCPGYP